MKKWSRRIGGALRMGLTWAITWFGVGLAATLILALVGGPGAGADVPVPLGLALFGFLAGVIFSVFLGSFEGGRRFEEMSLPRFAGWGAVGGLLMSLIFVLVSALVGETIPLEHLGLLAPVFSLAGAASSAGLLALARRGERREALPAGWGVPELGRTRGEARKRLGGGD